MTIDYYRARPVNLWTLQKSSFSYYVAFFMRYASKCIMTVYMIKLGFMLIIIMVD